jgi:TonB family protein
MYFLQPKRIVMMTSPLCLFEVREKGGLVQVRKLTRLLVIILMFSFALLACLPATATDEERQPTSRVSPQYPELAKKMKVTGAVRLELTIASDGTVRFVRALGGHPLLVEAATAAVKKWRYKPGTGESITVVQFHFDGTPS